MERKRFTLRKLIDREWKLFSWLVLWAGLGYLLLWLLDPDDKQTGIIFVGELFLMAGTVYLFALVTNKPIMTPVAFLIFLVATYYFIDYNESKAGVMAAWATVTLAIAAFATIDANRNMRKQENELASKKRRLEEVHRWVTQVMNFCSRGLEQAIPQAEYVAQTDADNARTIAATKANARAIAANKSYIILEAERLDFELNGLTQLQSKHPKQLKDIIESISGALENIGTSAESFSDFSQNGPVTQEIENNCIEAMQIISDLRAELRV